MRGIYQRSAAMQQCRGAEDFFQSSGLRQSAAAGNICQKNPMWRSPVAIVAAGILTTLVGIGAARAQMALPGSFELSDTGAATYTIPIAVPPGTAGMQPALSLAYDSQGGNGLLGMGWSLTGLPAITRCGQTLAQDGVIGGVNYDGNDRFCLDGQRLLAISGSYGADQTEYRTERESFSRIISYSTAGNGPAAFKAWTKSGQVLEFGTTGDSQIEAQGKSSVRVWALQKISDTKGNYITITYAEDNNSGQYYLTRIDYTGNTAAGVQPYASVQLSYIARADNFPSAEGGSISRLPDLVSHIYTKIGTTVVRDYRFTYNNSPRTGRARLASITACDAEGANANCLPATTFGWQDSNPGFVDAGTITTPFGDLFQEDFGLRWFVTDVNGDGRSDFVIRSSDGQFYTYLSNGTTFQAPSGMPTGSGDQPANTGQRYFFMDMSADGLADLVVRQGDVFNIYLSTGTSFAWSGYAITGLGDHDESIFGRRWFVMDVNGDGKQDMVTRNSSGVFNIFLSNGATFVWSGYTSAIYGDTNESLMGTRWFVMDVNGDGRQDIVIRSPSGSFYIHLSNGATFDTTPIISVTAFADSPTASGTRYFVMDVNGDGRTDMVIRQGSVFNIYLSSGNTLIWSGNCTTAFGDVDEATSGQRWFPMDVNGDGKMDMVIRDSSGNIHTYLSNGQTFYFVGTSSTGYGDANEDYNGVRWFVLDVNGDGKQDFMPRGQNGEFHVFLSNGSTFSDAGVTATGFGDQSPWIGQRWFPMDVNGDGRIDIAVRNLTDIKAFQAAGAFPDLLTSITSGLNGTSTITYKSLSEGGTLYTKGTGALFPVVDFQGPHYVVSAFATSNGVGGTYDSSYRYSGARVHAQGRGFLGFEKIVVRDENTGIEEHTTYRQDHPFTGMVASQQKKLAALTLNETVNTYDVTNFGNGRTFPYLKQSVAKSWELNGTLVSQVTTQNEYDNFGNVTLFTVATPDGYSKTTTNIYANDTLNWLLGRLTHASVTNTTPAATATRVSAFEYDATSGLLTKEIIEPDQTQFRLETLYAYDAFGNKLAATLSSPATGQAAITSRTSSNAYDASGRFATSSINALNHTETRSYDARFGAAIALTGPNALTTTWDSDSFGRKTLETRADGIKTRWEYLFCSGVNGGTQACPTLAKYLVKTTPLAADGATQNGPWTKAYFDVLGRAIQSETQGFDGTSIIIIATQYDDKGRVAKKSRPLFGTSGTNSAWAPGTYTSFTYDAIERVTAETRPDNSASQFAYNGLTTTATNSLSQTKTTIKNSQGQVVQVKDTQNNTTSFAYDPFGNLTSTADAAGNVITASFDVRGRKVAMTDPDMGAWSYVYDALDQLLQQTDAKGQVTTMAYDKLGRITSRVEVGFTSTWTYDTATKGIGKLASAAASNGYLRTQLYDSLGRPWRTQRWIDQVVTDPGYNSDTSYDVQGRVLALTYPSGFKARYEYTALGYLQYVKNDTSNALFWQANTMDAEGHLTQQTYGNNVVTNQSFDAPTGRPLGITAGLSATPTSVQNMSFAWDNIGNLTGRTDTTQNVQETFSYDTLNRLTGSAVVDAPALTKTIQYNAIGNITFKSDAGNYTYNASGASSVRPHALTSIAGTINATYTYDANGNMLTGAGRTVTYTAFNMPATLARGAVTTSFAYDSEHNRTKQVASDGTTIYLGPSTGFHAEKLVSPTGTVRWANYIHAGGGMVAAYYEQTTSGGGGGGGGQTYTGSDDHGGQTLIGTSSTADTVVYPRPRNYYTIITNNSPDYYGMPTGGVYYEIHQTGGGIDSALFIERAQFSDQTIDLATGLPVSGGTPTTYLRYFHKDHLGSISVITNELGAVTERLSYDAWGKRRFPTGTDDPGETITSSTDRGFTGHEHLEYVGLIHMNARVYDPQLGRFMSADSILPDPLNGQSRNRYNYVLNSPLSWIDPSGHEGLRIEIWCWWCGEAGYDNFEGLDELSVRYFAGYNFGGGRPFHSPFDWSNEPLLSLGHQRSAPSSLGNLNAQVQSTRQLGGVSGGKAWSGSGAGASPGGAGFALTSNASAYIHGALTIGSFAPSFIGSAFSLAESALYAAEGNWTDAGISLAAVGLGVVGSAGVAKLALRGAKEVAEVVGAAKGLTATKEVAGSIRNVNPLRSTTNCVNCAIATDATLAGRPASAIASGPTAISALEGIYGGQFLRMSGQASIESQLLSAGSGARGIVFGSRGPGQVGHVFNGVNQSGTIRFLDGQAGTAASFEGFTELYFLRTF